MSGENGYTPRDEKSNGVTRRDFLKYLGIGAATAATGGAIYAAKEIGENNLENKIEELLSGEVASIKVPKGYGIDHFYARSGWNEGRGSIDSFTYREAVQKMNQMESVMLQEGQILKVPIREGQSLQGGE